MPWRALPDHDWQRIIAEVASYPDVTFGCAGLTGSGGRHVQTLLVTVRGGRKLPYVEHYFPGIYVSREQLPGSSAARALMNHRVGSVEIPPAPESTRATWVTGGDDIGLVAPSPVPRLYYSWTWGADQTTMQSIQPLMDTPLWASGKTFYPTLQDALLELLLGRTRNPQRTIYPALFGVVSLAYDQAYFGAVDYVADEGIVAQVVESSPGAASGYELQVAYQLHRTDQELHRHIKRIEQGGPLTVVTGAPPLLYWAALLDRGGNLIDHAERYGGSDTGDDTAPPSPMAVAEALDFLDSAWFNVFGRHLVGRVQLTSVANLTQTVNRREDFESRLSHLSDLLSAFRIGDDLLERGSVRQLKSAGSLLRMKNVLSKRLSEPDRTSAFEAVAKLRAIVELRGALQHPASTDTQKPDLPTALRRLSIGFPPDWQRAWTEVQLRTMAAGTEIRRALLATLTE